MLIDNLWEWQLLLNIINQGSKGYEVEELAFSIKVFKFCLLGDYSSNSLSIKYLKAVLGIGPFLGFTVYKVHLFMINTFVYQVNHTVARLYSSDTL